MGVGAGLYMCDVVKKFTFAISSPDEFLYILLDTKCHFGDVPQANLLASYGKTKPNTTKARIHRSKEMY